MGMPSDRPHTLHSRFGLIVMHLRGYHCEHLECYISVVKLMCSRHTLLTLQLELVSFLQLSVCRDLQSLHATQCSAPVISLQQ